MSHPATIPLDFGTTTLPHTAPQQIAEQAKLRPDSLALVMGADRLTYGELEARGSRLANHLRALGAGPEVVVALCLERSPGFVVAALAVMKCGAAYLPMDQAHPAERLRFIVQDAGAGLLVTEQRLAEQFATSEVTIIDIDEHAMGADTNELSLLNSNIDDLAYVIYTSGSTGQPKGVEITQRNLANLIAWHRRAFGIDSSARATFQASVGFDAAVWEIWPALTAGAALYLPDKTTRVSPELLRDWMVANEITISFVSTAVAEQLITLRWPAETALRFLLTGADTLHRFPPAGLPFVLINNYGPTECTVVATSAAILPDGRSNALPSIGTAIDRVHINLLDEQLCEVAEGTDGEIFIGGAGVARGYRNRVDLTTERFVLDPFRADGSRLYRTGDRARRLANGEFAFLGRLDEQVKIRGYRIELGEINAVLNAQPSVQSSVVVAREDEAGAKRLVAYIVAAAGAQPSEESLRELMQTGLPDYMQPTAYVWLESLPLTPNGKVDRAALPAPVAMSDEFVAPRTPVEERLASIITDVLKLPRVSVHDDFFQLGAHSLLGAQVIARVRGAFGTELKLLDVFDSPTVAELSVKIEEALTRQLSAMSEAEVEAALAALETGARETVQV